MSNDEPTTTTAEITFYGFVEAALANDLDAATARLVADPRPAIYTIGGDAAHSLRIVTALMRVFDRVGGSLTDPIAREIAAIYALHRDYREEWRP